MEPVYSNIEVSLTRDLRSDLREITAGFPKEKVFLLFETNTYSFCWPLVNGFREIKDDNILVLEPGEENKSIEQVIRTWAEFGRKGLDRGSLIINIGGGMLTDLGGFVACTLKRGVAFVNIPTTLLAMVDASVGGKTGINFRGLKNEVGIIRQPMHVYIYPPFLSTLDRPNLLSGFAEMLKSGLVADQKLWADLRQYDFDFPDQALLESLIWRSVDIKKIIVDADPYETGLRKSLNFGHTIGHAIESEALHDGNPVPHGYAVAWGMVSEARLSSIKLGLPAASLEEIRQTITRLYGLPGPLLQDPGRILPWMRFDKKNTGDQINFTLLEEIGRCRINCTANEEEIIRSLKGEICQIPRFKPGVSEEHQDLHQ